MYEDGSHVLFLNSHYVTGNAGPAITEYLDYIRTNDDTKTYTSELLHKTVKRVQEVRSDEKMEVCYMMWELKYQDAVAEGRAEGRAEGERASQIKTIKRMLSRGLSLEEISDMVGLELDEVKKLVEQG